MSTESAHDVNADTTEATRKMREALWRRLLDAQRAVPYGRSIATARERDASIAYRNGLMDAFAIVTEQDPEAVAEALQDAIVADHEVSLMHREDIPGF